MKYKDYQNILECLDILSINIVRLKDVKSNYAIDPESIIYYNIDKIDSVGFDIHEFRVVFNQYKSECERARINMANEVDLYFIKCRDELNKQRRFVLHKLKELAPKYTKGGIVPKENRRSAEIGLDNMPVWECRKRTKTEYVTLKDNGFIPNVWDKMTIRDYIKARKESVKSFEQDVDRYDEIIKSTINLSQCSIMEVAIALPKLLEQRLKEVQEKYKQYEKDQTYFIDVAIAANAIWKVYRSIFGFKPGYDTKGILRY